MYLSNDIIQFLIISVIGIWHSWVDSLESRQVSRVTTHDSIWMCVPHQFYQTRPQFITDEYIWMCTTNQRLILLPAKRYNSSRSNISIKYTLIASTLVIIIIMHNYTMFAWALTELFTFDPVHKKAQIQLTAVRSKPRINAQVNLTNL